MMDGGQKNFVLLAAKSNQSLATLIASHLNMNLGDCQMHTDSMNDTVVSINEDLVRARNVFIIQTGYDNNSIMEMLMMAYACKRNNSNKIVAVIPYLPYSKQCKLIKRGCIVPKLLAKLMQNAGFTHVITMDLLAKEIQGFFDIPVENLRASSFMLRHIQEKIYDSRNAVMVARIPKFVQKATSYAERLQVGIAYILAGVENSTLNEFNRPHLSDTGRNNNKNDESVDDVPKIDVKSHIDSLTVVGDVKHKVAIMVEDILDDENAKGFVDAAIVLKAKGAGRIYVLATHAIISFHESTTAFQSAPIDEIVVTNTVPNDIWCSKIRTVDISELLSDSIRRIHHEESMGYLYRDEILED